VAECGSGQRADELAQEGPERVVKLARGPLVWARRALLAIVLVGAAVIPGRASSHSDQHCAGPRCTAAGSVLWTTALPGSWLAESGGSGTVTSQNGAYAGVGGGLAVVGSGATVTAFTASTGKRLWGVVLTGVPAGSAIVGVRAFRGVVAVGVAPPAGQPAPRSEIILSAAAGAEIRSYPAASYGGAVRASVGSTVIVGAQAVTDYDNPTGKVIWRRDTGTASQTWRVSGHMLYMTDSPDSLGSIVPALRQIDLRTGGERIVRPKRSPGSLSYFPGTLSDVVNGIALFSGPHGVWAYSGQTGEYLWSHKTADLELASSGQPIVYLTQGNQLIGVKILTGHIVSWAAISVTASLYWVTDGVALGLDQNSLGEAWGYNLRTRQIVWSSEPLPWPHFFVDLSGLGGSASQASDLVLLATCAQVGNAATPNSAPGCQRPELAAVRV
jgi:outer membrane protein assembly factor BamB